MSGANEKTREIGSVGHWLGNKRGAILLHVSLTIASGRRSSWAVIKSQASTNEADE